MSKNASLTMMKSSAPGLRDADAKRRSAAFWSRHGEQRLSIEDVDEVAWELGVSRATLYRLIAAFRANRTVSSVEPRRRGLVAWRLCETRLDVGAVSIMPPERGSLA